MVDGCNAFTVLVGEDDLNSFRTVNSLFPFADSDLLALDEASIWSCSVVLVKQQVEKLPYRAEAHASH